MTDRQKKKKELLDQIKQKIEGGQLSLFEVAPWSGEMRAMPNDLARAALFTTRNRRIPRKTKQNHPVFHINKNVMITYTGIELRAEDDELVWQQVLEYCKYVTVGEPASFTFYQLCTDLGWPINGRYYERAEACMTRLQATALQFSSERLGQLESISLIHRFRVVNRGSKASRCMVTIDKEMLMLFAGKHYSRFVWSKYRQLSPTARRLFDYFASHKDPFPLRLDVFRQMCGSDSLRANKWREQVNHACNELVKSELIQSAWVENDIVCCER